MSKIKVPWINGKRLLERWKMRPYELHQAIFFLHLPVYNSNLEKQDYIIDKETTYIRGENSGEPEFYTEGPNNLYWFDRWVNKDGSPHHEGWDIYRILDSMLFKMEDVKRFEQKYGKKKNGVPDHFDGTSEFVIYDSIVNGELRPFLEVYSPEDYIENLIKKLWSVSFRTTEDGTFEISPERKELAEIIGKPGDTIKIDFDETDLTKPGKLTNITNDMVEELIDIDIPPPPDLKTEYFLDLITIEYAKIKLRANKALKTSSNEEQVSLFANRNIQILKEIAGQAHLLSKRLRTEGEGTWDDPDSYIIYILKTHLIRSICFYQELFQPYLKVPIQDEFELRTSLYGEKSYEAFVRNFEERSRNLIYKQLRNEIQTLRKRHDKSSDYTIGALKILTSTEKWLNTISKEAVSRGFIGASQLMCILASEEKYLKDSILELLFANFLSKYDSIGELSTSDYKSRLNIWRKLIGFWSAGNSPWGKQLYDTYLPEYLVDETTKGIDEKDLKEKYNQLVQKRMDEGLGELSFKEKMEYAQSINSAAKFIKLSELKKYFVDVIGIPLPSLLFPESIEVEERTTVEDIHPLSPEDFIKNLRVSYESDSEVKIQEPNRIGKTFNHGSLGFTSNQTKQWRAFINVLQDPPHIYETVTAHTFSAALKKKIRKPEYGRRQKRLRIINNKLIIFFNKEYKAQLPEDFKLYDPCKEEGPGKYRFKFQIPYDDGIEGDLQLVYEQYPKNQLMDEIFKLPGKYRALGGTIDKDKFINSIEGEKFVEASKVAVIKGWLTGDDISKIFDTGEQYLPDNDLNLKR